MFIVCIDKCSPALSVQMRIHLPFSFLHAFKSAEAFQMRFSNIGDQPIIRHCNAAQQINFLLMICTHFNDSKICFCRHRQNCKRHTDVIIQISFRCMNIEFFCKNISDQFFRCRFSIRSCYG